ncbi:MAG: heme ABC transporter ATP-binding protein [Porticoccaceae bacterium]
MALRADGIALHLSGFDLLRDIAVAVTPGKVTAVVGPNGAGKSSLLKVLTGDNPVSSGTVSLNGRPLVEWPPAQRARILGVLPQHTVLDFPFTAREVVALGRTPHDTGTARDAEIVAAALAAVDASYLEKRYYTNMSGGEKQRVQLARVLAQIWEPSEIGERFLLMDEPTSAFDLSHQQMCLDIVERFSASGVGVLMVLHDLNLAARCADNLVVLSCGAIAAQGSPAEILTEALLKEVFKVDALILRHPRHGTPLVIT